MEVQVKNEKKNYEKENKLDSFRQFKKTFIFYLQNIVVSCCLERNENALQNNGRKLMNLIIALSSVIAEPSAETKLCSYIYRSRSKSDRNISIMIWI